MAAPARGARRRRTVFAVVVALTGLVVLVLLAIAAVRALLPEPPPPRPNPRCVASTGDHTTAITNDQAWWTAIITGTSVKRGLPARAASIAMATVYQETGIRNLDYGDRDSVGLFQQRPSQGWGTVEQIMDPYYSTGKFYDALVKIRDWESRDITEMAQAVQRSAYPEAYRKHEANGRTLASTFTGWTPAGLSCLYPDPPDGDLDALDDFLVTTLGIDSGDRVTPRNSPDASPTPANESVRYDLASEELAWSVAHLAIASGSRFGTLMVEIGSQAWAHDASALASWTTAEDPLPRTQVTITVRAS